MLVIIHRTRVTYATILGFTSTNKTLKNNRKGRGMIKLKYKVTNSQTKVQKYQYVHDSRRV